MISRTSIARAAEPESRALETDANRLNRQPTNENTPDLVESRDVRRTALAQYEPYAVLNSSTGPMLAGGTKGHTHFGAPGAAPSKDYLAENLALRKRKATAGQRRP